MMRTNLNYYALLGVSSTATPDEITRAFRKRILEVHLDKQPQGEDSDLCYKTIEAHRILSDRNLRIKYDIEFGAENKRGETFIPAGYICYDVGEDRLSMKVLQDIANWKEEFDRVNSTGSGFSDNYFSCISSLMNEVVNEQNPEKPSGFFCEVCDKHFMTPEHHWEQVILPYISMFSCDKSGVDSLFQYYETVLTSEAFNWKPTQLPSQLFGIWASLDWDEQSSCDKVLVNILLDVPTTNDVEELISYIEETFINDDDIDEDVFPKVASEILCWVLEHQDSQDDVTEKVLELIATEDVKEILYFVSAMKNFLNCNAEEWTGLISDALEVEELELAMVWTKIAIGFHELAITEWFDLGMKIYSSDPVLAHICFMNGRCNDNDEEWEYVANEFTRRRNHFAAAGYHMNFSKGGLDRLIQKSKLLQKTDRKGAKLYKNIYYSIKIKFLLTNLQRPESMSTFKIDLKSLIELTEDLTPNCNWNCLEGFKIIVNTWPTEFDETHCLGIHRSTLDNILIQQNLKYLNVKSFNIVLAAVHYLPEDEVDEEFVGEESVQLTKRQISQSMRTSDFKSLAEILLLMTKRAIPGAAEFLDNLHAEETRTHLKSMKLLISGTINKIRDQNWIGAIKDYQNALLCAPECSHLVIPCIIKLSQEIEFHTAVVDQVQSEVKNLKQLIESTGYLHIEKFGSEQSSLIITDVAPKSTSLYKNAISKIQSEPPKEPDPAEPVEPPPPAPVETNTPLVTLDKNEEAIESSQGLGGLNSALAYIDLLRALPLQFQPGPIVMAASHFLQAMDECESDVGSLFAYRNAIVSMAENLLQIDEQSQAAIQHCLTHKQMLSILLCAHEKLSKAIAGENPNDKGEDVGKHVEMITKSDANLISKFFKNVVNFPKVEPLASIPTLSCSDLIYVETIGNTFLSRFCFEKVTQGKNNDFNKIPKSVHAYTHFIEVWKGRSTLTDFETARLQAMKELLALKKWTVRDVEDFVNVPMLSSTEDGWTSEQKISLQFPDPSKSYRSIHGFRIKSGQISFLCSKETKTLGNLFDTNDLHEIFCNEILKSSLSLICPDDLKKSHPFKEVNFEPHSLTKSDVPNYFKTLTRVSTLICFLASGLEVCGKSPFQIRKIEDGLIKRLPEHLQHFIRPISARWKEKKSNSNSNILKEFCLNMTEVFEEEEEDESGFTYKVGGVSPQLNITSTTLINEAEFAQDFTKHYNEIAKQFPELARLKELVKISVIYSKLKKVLEGNIKLMRQNGRSKEEIGKISNICKEIKQLGIKSNIGNVNRKNISQTDDDCIWVPATFCNNIEPEVYDVSARINMSPTVIYGPVSVPKNFVVVPVSEFACNNPNESKFLKKF